MIITGIIPVGVPDQMGNVITEEAAASLARQLTKRYSGVIRGEYTIVPNGDLTRLGEIQERMQGDRAALLASVEAEAEALQGSIVRAQWGVLRLLERIREQELYRAAWDDANDRYFDNFSDYLPSLLKRWHTKGIIPSDSVRLVYTYQRIERVFLNPDNGFGLTQDEISKLGVTHFDQLAGAIDYDRETGQVADTPREHKLGKSEALALVGQMRSAAQDNEPWTVQQTRETLNEARGVSDRSVGVTFRSTPDGYYLLSELFVFENGIGTEAGTVGLDKDQMDFLCKRLGVKNPRIVE